MTIDEIKKNLPPVKVKLANHVTVGRVYGRQLKFAQVVVYDYTLGRHNSWEFSWSAIEYAINNDEALIV